MSWLRGTEAWHSVHINLVMSVICNMELQQILYADQPLPWDFPFVI